MNEKILEVADHVDGVDTTEAEEGPEETEETSLDGKAAKVTHRDTPSTGPNTLKHTRSTLDYDSTSTLRKKGKKMQKRAPFPHTTYEMINNCDPDIASWTSDGDMFVVKEPNLFAKIVIPEYFDHSKFESFTRQLNFYGFNKVESQVMKLKDIDQRTINHVTFYNEFFKRGRRDLLNSIQRSTNRGKSQTNYIESLEAKLTQLSEEVRKAQLKLADMENLKQRIVTLELKLSQGQLEPKPNLLAEKETAAKSFKKFSHDAHSLPYGIKRNDAPSPQLMKNSVKNRNRTVGFCDNPDPGAKASGYLNELGNTNPGEGDAALSVLSEIRQHPMANINSPESVKCAPDSLIKYDDYEDNISHTTVPICDKTSLIALQRGISKFWETLTRE